MSRTDHEPQQLLTKATYQVHAGGRAGTGAGVVLATVGARVVGVLATVGDWVVGDGVVAAVYT